MSDPTWNAVDTYIESLFVPADPALATALAESEAGGLPSIAVSPIQGKFLMLLARIQGARRILEIGTLGGYSTLWLARALPPGGRLVTLEYSPAHAAVAEANIARAGAAGRVEIRVGRAQDTLPLLAAEGGGPFDLIFIDADKAGYPEYLGWSLRLSRPGTLIIADNVVRNGKIIDAESDDPNIRGARRFNELLAAELRVEAVIIQTVGSKGYDGLSLARVR